MKTILALVVLIGMSIPTMLSAQDNQEDTLKVKSIVEAKINVPTIKCGSCVSTVTKALRAVEGVVEVSVNGKSKLVTVQYDEGKVKLNKLEKAIALSGYDANDVKRDEAAYEQLDACCK